MTALPRDQVSENTLPPSHRMQLLNQREIAEPDLQAAAPSAPIPISKTTTIDETAWRAGFIAALNLMVLAARVITLVAIGGGIALTAMALGDPNVYRLGALLVYGLVTVAIVWIVSR